MLLSVWSNVIILKWFNWVLYLCPIYFDVQLAVSYMLGVI